MAATAAVLIFHKKRLDAFASDSSLILKKFITGWIGFLRDVLHLLLLLLHLLLLVA
jgi:hypothetical protein